MSIFEIILRGSKELEDFWSFLKKYQALKKRKPTANKGSEQATQVELSTNLRLPQNYDRRWRLNFIYKPCKMHMATYDAQGTI
jgi:hypothetical protein